MASRNKKVARLTTVLQNGETQNFARLDPYGYEIQEFDGIQTVTRILSAAASVNDTAVKATPGKLFRVRGRNAKAAIVYMKLYDKVATVVQASDVPVATIELAASAAFDIDLGPRGLDFANGIRICFTGAVGDTDTTALTSADLVCVNIFSK